MPVYITGQFPLERKIFWSVTEGNYTETFLIIISRFSAPFLPNSWRAFSLLKNVVLVALIILWDSCRVWEVWFVRTLDTKLNEVLLTLLGRNSWWLTTVLPRARGPELSSNSESRKIGFQVSPTNKCGRYPLPALLVFYDWTFLKRVGSLNFTQDATNRHSYVEGHIKCTKSGPNQELGSPKGWD